MNMDMMNINIIVAILKNKELKIFRRWKEHFLFLVTFYIIFIKIVLNG